jgi:hypothetical protein
MTRCLLDGDALAAFNRHASTQTQVNDAKYTLCVQALANHVFPKNALAVQRQWFHRYLHKRIEDSMHEFVAWINEINGMMGEFPPDFYKMQMISKTEMKDLLEFAVPTSWRVKMVEHAFHPIEHDLPDIVEFCEWQEFTERVTKSTQSGDNNQSSNTRNNNQTKGKNSETGQQRHDKVDTLQYAQSNRMNKHKRPTTIVSFEKSDGCDGCALHAKATDHMTAECHVIRKQIDNMRAQWNAQLQNTFKKQKTNNQPKKQGGDLHAMLDDVKKSNRVVQLVESVRQLSLLWVISYKREKKQRPMTETQTVFSQSWNNLHWVTSMIMNSMTLT